MLAVSLSVVERGKKSPQWNLDADLSGELSLTELLDFTKRSLIVISDFALKEEQAKGFDQNPVIAVDNKIGKPILNVNPLGRISFTARQSADTIISDLFEAVIKRSPVDTGFYKDHHVVLYNGVSVANTSSSLATWLSSAEIKDGDTIRIVNIAPYATSLELEGVRNDSRKLKVVKSRDKKQRSGTHVRAANGAYFLAARSVGRKFKFNSKIFFEFISGSNINVAGGFPKSDYRGKPLRSSFTGRSGPGGGRKGHKWKGPYVYPSIRILIQGGGIL